jgi:histone deacetylase 6
LKDYIAWIVGKGYAVIDVNIPKHISREIVSQTDLMYAPDLTVRSRLVDTSQKMRTDQMPPRSWPHTCGTTTSSKPIYPNSGYRKLTHIYSANQATEIFLLGVGNAFYGVANLLINRGKQPNRVKSIDPR